MGEQTEKVFSLVANDIAERKFRSDLKAWPAGPEFGDHESLKKVTFSLTDP